MAAVGKRNKHRFAYVHLTVWSLRWVNLCLGTIDIGEVSPETPCTPDELRNSLVGRSAHERIPGALLIESRPTRIRVTREANRTALSTGVF